MKTALYIIAAIAAIAIIGAIVHNVRVALRNKEEMARYEKNVALSANLGKVLVVYYSYSGKTKAIAEQIQKLLNADIYEITTAEKMPGYATLIIEAAKQIRSKEYPRLNENLPDITPYDTIFVGTPVWDYTLSTPVSSYLQLVDFNGKKVVPFSTQGSNTGSTFEDFKAQAKNAKILKEASFNNIDQKYDEQVKNKITTWLNSL